MNQDYKELIDANGGLINLNLGCGGMILPGFINCDKYDEQADVMCDVLDLPFDTGTVDSIYASHILEHFDFKEAFVALDEWKRVLKEGAILSIETPDLLGTCVAFVEATDSERVPLYGHLFATPWIDGQVHKFLYTESQLSTTLEWLGFRDIKRIPALRYVGCESINLRMECVK